MKGIYLKMLAAVLFLTVSIANLWDFNHPRIGPSTVAIFLPYTILTGARDGLTANTEYEVRRAESYPEYKRRLIEVATRGMDLEKTSRKSVEQNSDRAVNNQDAIYDAQLVEDYGAMTTFQMQAAAYFLREEAAGIRAGAEATKANTDAITETMRLQREEIERGARESMLRAAEERARNLPK